MVQLCLQQLEQEVEEGTTYLMKVEIALQTTLQVCIYFILFCNITHKHTPFFHYNINITVSL